jgi:hypothetical protein
MPIRAWAVSEDTGYTVRKRILQPRIGIRADIASGDAGKSRRTLGSFDPLFPALPVYSGPSGLLGPTNLIDVTPSLRLKLSKAATATLECSSFWRESTHDSVYSPFITPIRATGSNAPYVATAPSVTLAWQANRHLFYSAIYTRFLTGGFFAGSPPDKDVNYIASWISYRV